MWREDREQHFDINNAKTASNIDCFSAPMRTFLHSSFSFTFSLLRRALHGDGVIHHTRGFWIYDSPGGSRFIRDSCDLHMIFVPKSTFLHIKIQYQLPAYYFTTMFYIILYCTCFYTPCFCILFHTFRVSLVLTHFFAYTSFCCLAVLSFFCIYYTTSSRIPHFALPLQKPVVFLNLIVLYSSEKK